MLGSARTAALAAALVMSLFAGCGDDPDGDGAAGGAGPADGPQTFTVLAGAADPDAPPDLAVFDFYPSAVSVHPGDVVRFDNGSGRVPVPHTVTLGRGADVPGRLPPPLAPGVGAVPAVWGLCVTAEPIAPAATDCPDRTKAPYPPETASLEMPAFAAQVFYNSGIFDTGQSLVMPVAEEIEPGSYTFFCYLHPATMELTLDVVGPGRPTQAQADLDRRAAEAIDRDVADGLAAEAAADKASRPAATVQAGAEQGKAVVTRFFPSTVTVAAGDTVTWVNPGFDPHVVALGKTVPPHDPQNFAPPTLAPGGDYRGGFVISGVFGQPPFPMDRYAVRFPDRGRYEFYCPIHPGMFGTVEVT